MNTSKILFICTGNICRSPMAEVVFNEMAGRRELPIRSQSYGVIAFHSGEDMDPRARETLTKFGYHPPPHSARMIRKDNLSNSMSLALDKSHLMALYKMGASSEIKVSSGEIEGAKLLLDFAPNSEIKEVPDPYYGSIKDFEISLDLIEVGCSALLDYLEINFNN